MKRDFHRRLTRLEDKRHPDHPVPRMIILVGVPPGGEKVNDDSIIGYRRGDGEIIARQPGESIWFLQERIVKDLRTPELFSEVREA